EGGLGGAALAGTTHQPVVLGERTGLRVRVEVAQLVDQTGADLQALDRGHGLAILSLQDFRHVEGELGRGTVASLAQRAALVVEVLDAGKGLLALASVEPVLTV